MSKEISLEEYKEAWREMTVQEAWRGFIGHLAAYIIVNGFMIFINLWTSPHTLWFPWMLGGWGVGLAFHGVFSRKSHVLGEIEKKEALAELLARKKRKGR